MIGSYLRLSFSKEKTVDVMSLTIGAIHYNGVNIIFTFASLSKGRDSTDITVGYKVMFHPVWRNVMALCHVPGAGGQANKTASLREPDDVGTQASLRGHNKCANVRVECRTFNPEDWSSRYPDADSKLRQFRSLDLVNALAITIPSHLLQLVLCRLVCE